MFPSLVEFSWDYLSDVDEVDAENLSQLTNCHAHLPNDPFEFISELPRVKTIDLECYPYMPLNLPPFELQSLTKLKLNCPDNMWTPNELKAVFTYFPNISDLFLGIYGLDENYDEQVT